MTDEATALASLLSGAALYGMPPCQRLTDEYCTLPAMAGGLTMYQVHGGMAVNITHALRDKGFNFRNYATPDSSIMHTFATA
jgi:hypothetical protein